MISRPMIHIEHNTSPDDDSPTAVSEREEAMWCHIVLLTERLKRTEKELQTAIEMTDLQRDRIHALERAVRASVATAEAAIRSHVPSLADVPSEPTRKRNRLTGVCLDCQTAISHVSVRCRKCAAVVRSEKRSQDIIRSR